MERIPFNESEMTPVEVIKGRAFDRTLWSTPITHRENLLAAFRHEDPLFLSHMGDVVELSPRCNPEIIAGHQVRDNQPAFPYDNENGHADAFGVRWVMDRNNYGPIEMPGEELMEDLSELNEKITWPNPEEWAWEETAAADAPYLAEVRAKGKAVRTSVLTGFFERLISWMGFENAAMAMIDEDQEEYIHQAFSGLCDFYEKIFSLMKKYYDIDIIKFHDDWGSQNAPFFSPAVHKEMIVPYVKRLVDYAHSLGCVFEMHSCGKIQALLPNMVEMGVDSWQGQEVNDKLAAIKEYGDKILIEIEVPEVGVDATDEEIWAAAEKFCDEYIIPGHATALSTYANFPKNRSEFFDALYVCSRKKLNP